MAAHSSRRPQLPVAAEVDSMRDRKMRTVYAPQLQDERRGFAMTLCAREGRGSELRPIALSLNDWQQSQRHKTVMNKVDATISRARTRFYQDPNSRRERLRSAVPSSHADEGRGISTQAQNRLHRTFTAGVPQRQAAGAGRPVPRGARGNVSFVPQQKMHSMSSSTSQSGILLTDFVFSTSTVGRL